jgi:MarR family transcriptional regulator for hemolysin
MSTAIEKDILILLSDVARHIRTHADRRARRHGMTWAQLMILRRLERRPGMSQNELSAIAEVAPITVARLVDRIEALGLLKRYVDPKDRRVWRLRTTPAAAATLRDSKRYQAELDELIVKGMDSTALDAMISSLRKMKANVNSGRRLVKASLRERPNVKA